MFHVDRYDPEAQKQKAKRKDDSNDGTAAGRKRVKPQHQNKLSKQPQPATSVSSLRVIANEATEPSSIRASKMLLPEAFDDLDLMGDDVMAEEETPQHDIVDEDEEDVAVLKDISPSEIQTAISISEMPLEEVATKWKLAPFLVDNLRRENFQHFFPIQALAIPDVIASERHAHVRAQDICITAPTGSGKTLSYVLPILNALANHNGGARRLYALVVLPSRDLATQVFTVFERYVVGSTLKVGLAIGQSDFVAEQMSLTVDVTSNHRNMLQNRLSYDPGNLELALRVHYGTAFETTTTTDDDTASSGSYHIPNDGWSNIDILVCTPGRLVDHLDHTPGFTLQHLRFLVVDEADRLLSQSYQKWIDRVIDASNEASVRLWNKMIDGKLPPLQSTDLNSVSFEPITWRRGGSTGDHSHQFNTNDSTIAAKVCQQIQLRKFLVSATLTRDPQKLASLRLVNPKHFNVHQLKGDVNKYSMPTLLEEFVVGCTAEQKPMVLLSLLIERLDTSLADDIRKSMTVIFTSSLDSTHRLCRLLQLLWGTLKYGADSVGEFSSSLNQQERAELLSRCHDPKNGLSIIVCSDGMSRGMDLDFVDTVINYDIPTLAKTYVHRCGRTARASRQGTAISLLKGGQSSLFYRMRNLIQEPHRVQTMQLKKSVISNASDVYRLCMKSLRDLLNAEANGEIASLESVTTYLPDLPKLPMERERNCIG
jgi:ATP-dependent RNA helicase DDX51/DBP6